MAFSEYEGGNALLLFFFFEWLLGSFFFCFWNCRRKQCLFAFVYIYIYVCVLYEVNRERRLLSPPPLPSSFMLPVFKPGGTSLLIFYLFAFLYQLREK